MAVVSGVVCAVLLVAGCGYQLGTGAVHGNDSFVSASLSSMSLEGMKRYAPLRLALKSALHAHSIRVVAPDTAPVRLVVIGEKILQRPLVITGDAKSREYLLTVSVEFSVRGADDRMLLEKQRVQSEEAYLYDNENPSTSVNERARTLQHIRRDLTRKIIARLAAVDAG